MTTDMTKGNPAKLIFFFAIPFLIGNIFQQFYNIADTVIVGRILGVEALASVGATGSFVWFAMGSIQGLTAGFSAITAQRFGADDKEGIKKSFAMSIILSIVFTAILTAFTTTMAYPILRLLNTPADIIEGSYNYVIWIFSGLFATTLFNLLSNIMRALGDSKTPLIFLIIACVINIILDVVCITVFKMGTAGAGFATFIAQLISGILCLFYMMRKFPILRITAKDMAVNKEMIIQLMRIGVPMAFLNIVLSVGGIIIQFVNNGLGTLYVASYAAANKIEQFIIQPIISFGSALSVYVAQNYGAKNGERIKKGVNQCMLMTFAFSILGTILMIITGRGLMYMIAGGESQELLNNGYKYIVINSTLTLILAPLVLYKSSLQAVGRTFVSVLTGFIEVGCRAGASILLTAMFGFTGLCFANPAAWLGALIPIIFDYAAFVKKISKPSEQEKKA